MTTSRTRPSAFAWLAWPLCLLAGCVAAPPLPPSASASAPATAQAIDTAASAPNGSEDAAGASVAAATVAEEHAAAPALSDPVRPDVRLDLDERATRVDLWERVRHGFSMPDLDSDLVRERERWYATRPDYVARMTERGGRYLFHIVEELDKRGMPTELALLPFIESAFNPQAMSVARASGMWQFIPSTGRDFELKQNVFRDDRRDVLASTRAALDYLQRLHVMFGDWQLALAAYNWGEGNVQRAIARNQKAGLPTNYESLRMPAETQLYLPKLQAVKNIVARPDDFDLRLPELYNHPYFLSVSIDRDIDVALAVKLAGIPLEEFQTLNPQMNRPVILAAGTQQLLLPYDSANRFVRELALHRGPLATWTAWTAPKTMKTGEAAKSIGMSEERLREVNQIPARMLIKAGSTLLVPRGTSLLADVSSHVADTATLSLAPDAPPLRRVSLRAARRDTVASVARRYRVSPAQLAEWNKVGPGASFTPGQTVVVYLAQGGRKAHSRTTQTARAAHGPRASHQASARSPAATKSSRAAASAARHISVARN
ncbi:MAG: transglycosylase SLT domain-containing protein [Caldimonas sp.]